MKEEQLYALIEQELSGTLDAADSRLLSDWRGQGSQEETEYHEIRSILEITQEGLAAIDPHTDDDFARLMQSIQVEEAAAPVEETVEETPVIPMRSSRSRTRIYGIAAAIVLLAVTSLIVFLPNGGGSGEAQVFAAAHGKTLQLNLPDQSQVTLNSESKLELAADFNQGDRKVKLEGEAFFDIARNEEKPFIIDAMGTQTRVLGTSFNVAAYPETEQVMVSVVSGTVEVSIQDQQVTLTANETALYDQKRNSLEQIQTAVKDDAAWKEGRLVFRNVPLKNAVVRLEKHYDLQFEISPELEDEPLSATYDVKQHGEDEIIDFLGQTFQGQIKREGNNVTIMK